MRTQQTARPSNTYTARPWGESYQPGSVEQSYGHRLSSRIESFQDPELGYYSDSHNVRAPESRSSGPERLEYSRHTAWPDNEFGVGSPGGVTRTRLFSSANSSAYQQLGNELPSGVSARGHTKSIRNLFGERFTSRSGSASPACEAVPQGRESQDIALLTAADRAASGHDQRSRNALGPGMAIQTETHTLQVDARVKKWQQQEQAGVLTGGLGAGFEAPRIQIRETDLESPSSPFAQRAPSRGFSFARRKLSVNRSATRRALAQSEANRSGQAVQIIVEEADVTLASTTKPPASLAHRGSHIDLSFVAGDSMPRTPGDPKEPSRGTTTASNHSAQRVETFYPVPNWKPFSMRWPYLLHLIVLSFALAGSVEAAYQRSNRHGSLVRFVTPHEIAALDYFSIKYLPTLVAVIYGVLWQSSEFEVKRLEAYHQLSKEDGARAAETLAVDYTTSFSLWHPYYAMRRRHYAVCVVSVATMLAVSAVPTLISFSIMLSPDRATREADPMAVKCIFMHGSWARLTEAVLIVIALLGCALFYLLETRRSGLLADVKGIAGLAAMANVSHILMDFKATDVATHDDIHARIKNHRYILRNSALAPMDDTSLDKNSTDLNTDLAKLKSRRSVSAAAGDKKKYQSTRSNPLPLMFRPLGFVPYITGVGLFTIFFPVCELTSWIEIFPGVLTALAVCIKLGWGALDTTTRLMEPFFILYNRHAPPKTLTLDYTALPFGWAAGQALVDGHWLVAAVGLGTVMTELLTVQVSSLATVEGRAFILAATSRNTEQDGIDAGEETEHTYWLSLVSALCILVYLCVVAVLVYAKRARIPFVPRQPNTIASVLAFIHQSKMLYDFVGTEKYSNAAMLQHLTDINREYGLGWFEGRDGRIHCGVDQEELSATYRHGVDFARSNKPWQESFEEWL